MTRTNILAVPFILSYTIVIVLIACYSMAFSFKQLFQTSFHLFQKYWKLFFLFSLVLLLPVAIGNVLSAVYGINKYTFLLQTVALLDLITFLPIVIVLALAGVYLTVPAIVFVYSWYEHAPLPSFKDVYRASKRFILPTITTSILLTVAISVFILVAGVILSIILSLFVPDTILNANFYNVIVLLFGLCSVLFVFTYQAIVIKGKKNVQAISESFQIVRHSGWRVVLAILLVLGLTTGVGMAINTLSDAVILFVSERAAGSLVQFNYLTALLSLPFQFLGIIVGLWATAVMTLIFAFHTDPPNQTEQTEL